MSSQPPPEATPSDIVATVRSLVRSIIAKSFLSRLFFARIVTGYSAGSPAANPGVKLPNETDSTTGTKTFKVVQPYSPFALPVAADVIAYQEDGNENAAIFGKVVDLASVNPQALGVAGINAQEPGTTNTFGTASTERNTNSASYVKLKEFIVPQFGRYRVSFRLSRSGGTAQAIVRIARPDPAGVTYIDASGAVTESSAAYPTFSATKSADMNVTAWPGSIISVWLLNTLGTAQTAYIDQCVIQGKDATATLSPYSAVIID